MLAAPTAVFNFPGNTLVGIGQGLPTCRVLETVEGLLDRPVFRVGQSDVQSPGVGLDLVSTLSPRDDHGDQRILHVPCQDNLSNGRLVGLSNWPNNINGLENLTEAWLGEVGDLTTNVVGWEVDLVVILPRQQAGSQWEVRHEADLVVMQVVEHALGQVVLVEEAEFVLDHVDVTVRIGLFYLIQAEVGDPNCPNLAGLFQTLEGTDRFGLGGIVVRKVNIEDVDVINAQPFQALVDLVRQELGTVIDDLFTGRKILGALGSQDDLVAVVFLYDLADQFFGMTQPIDIGRIKQVDSVVQCGPDEGFTILILEVWEEVVATHGVSTETKWGCINV